MTQNCLWRHHADCFMETPCRLFYGGTMQIVLWRPICPEPNPTRTLTQSHTTNTVIFFFRYAVYQTDGLTHGRTDARTD